MKTVIFGNSGSGKTWLANALALANNVPVIHLDEIYWKPGGFDVKREMPEIEELIKSELAKPTWVVEGVFGGLAHSFLSDANELIWLKLPWSVCKQRLQMRGSESKRHMSREQSESGLRNLIEWAKGYETRTDMQSYAGHLKLFESFGGKRYELSSEESVNWFVLHYLRKAPV